MHYYIQWRFWVEESAPHANYRCLHCKRTLHFGWSSKSELRQQVYLFSKKIKDLDYPYSFGTAGT
jgi:hypothetical protein